MAMIPDMGDPIADAIDAAVAAAETPRDGNTLSGSIIGKPCDRELWYGFRWAVEPESFSGRMLRLFNTGHVEEARMVAWLRLAGMTVDAVDPATGEQFEVWYLDGHGHGFTDGRVTGVPGAPVTPHLLECKTHSEKSFAEVKKHKVRVAKPEHFAQMQIYMHTTGLTRALYLAKNKNTDELYSERIAYDAEFALNLLARAERIRDASTAPPRISDNPGSYNCRLCKKTEVCHRGAFARVNCRTCLHSTPAPGGVWRCEPHKRDLSKEDQAAGCSDHLYLPDLVPGEQIDLSDDMRFVTYRLRDGTEWVNGPVETAPALAPGDDTFDCPMCDAPGADETGCGVCGAGPNG